MALGRASSRRRTRGRSRRAGTVWAGQVGGGADAGLRGDRAAARERNAPDLSRGYVARPGVATVRRMVGGCGGVGPRPLVRVDGNPRAALRRARLGAGFAVLVGRAEPR